MTEPDNDHPSPEQLAAHRAGRLAPADESAVARHLANCAACRELARFVPAPPLGTEGTLGIFRGGETTDYTRTDATPAPPPTVPPELLRHPRYEVLDLLGAGGMGVVFKARHLLMDRIVALKVIHRHLTSRPDLVERFRQEVQAAARLSHPNIVTAYDAEQVESLHVLVMEYVEGRTLDRILAERGPLPPEEVCEYMRQAALGLQQAFEMGLVHRDIKPHNLMLTPRGVVKVLDFGLARLDHETAEDRLTPVEGMLGTVDYLAPEQARSPQQADIRADIYSLGCTAYHLLAGRPPLGNRTIPEKLLAHQEGATRPLRQVRPTVPEGVSAVVEKMMARDPARRYQTPAEVEQALAGVLAGIAPRRPHRRRVLAALVAGAGLGLPLLAWAVWPRRKDGDRNQEPVPDELRCLGQARRGTWERVAIGPSCDRALAGYADGTVALWDLAAGREVVRWKEHGEFVMSVGVSWDGKWGMSGARDAVVCYWDLEGRKLVRKLEGHTSWVRGVAFAPDCTHALTGGNDAIPLYWDLESGELLKRLTGHRTVVGCVAVAGSGRFGVSAGWDLTARVWDLFDGKEVHCCEGHLNPIVSAAFSGDGRYVVTGAGDKTARLWSMETGREVRRFEGHDGTISCVCFSHEGRLLTSGTDQTIRLWDVATAEELHCFRGHLDDIWALAITPDRTQAISGSKDGTLRYWRLPPRRQT